VALSYFEDKEASLSNYLKPSISSSVNCGHVAANLISFDLIFMALIQDECIIH